MGVVRDGWLRWVLPSQSEKLAEHIEATNDKPHLSILPEDMRLITTWKDPYRWASLPGAEHLFTKQLRKHCLGAYYEIFHRIGNTIELKSAPSSPSRSLTPCRFKHSH